MDDNPVKAIEEARSLPSDTPIKGVLYTSLKAGVWLMRGRLSRTNRPSRRALPYFADFYLNRQKAGGFTTTLVMGSRPMLTSNPTRKHLVSEYSKYT